MGERNEQGRLPPEANKQQKVRMWDCCPLWQRRKILLHRRLQICHSRAAISQVHSKRLSRVPASLGEKLTTTNV